jgi:hypothetical protein
MWQLPALTSAGYFTGMLSRRIRTDGFIDPCISTLAAKPPSGPDWVYEIKHDGYRLTVLPGYVVRDANGQALASMARKTRRSRSLSTSPSWLAGICRGFRPFRRAR